MTNKEHLKLQRDVRITFNNMSYDHLPYDNIKSIAAGITVEEPYHWKSETFSNPIKITNELRPYTKILLDAHNNGFVNEDLQYIYGKGVQTNGKLYKKNSRAWDTMKRYGLLDYENKKWVPGKNNARYIGWLFDFFWDDETNKFYHPNNFPTN